MLRADVTGGTASFQIQFHIFASQVILTGHGDKTFYQVAMAPVSGWDMLGSE